MANTFYFNGVKVRTSATKTYKYAVINTELRANGTYGAFTCSGDYKRAIAAFNKEVNFYAARLTSDCEAERNDAIRILSTIAVVELSTDPKAVCNVERVAKDVLGDIELAATEEPEDIEEVIEETPAAEESLTKREEAVLIAYTRDDFYENGLDSILWTGIFMDTICGIAEGKAASGLISSLNKKGFLSSSEDWEWDINPRTGRKYKRDASTISLTEKGKQWLLAHADRVAGGMKAITQEIEYTADGKIVPDVFKVRMRTFTGMLINGTFEATLRNGIYTLVDKKGKILTFDCYTMIQTNAKNPKFANRIELV